jgi:hypothetical protein
MADRVMTPGRATGGVVVIGVVLAAALRVPFVHDQPYPDEGGLLVVASHWHAGGPFLYGRYFVDRPPLLLLFFRLAAALGGVVPVRLLGIGLVAAAVWCAARAGRLLGGLRGSVAGALTGTALLADPRLGTREVDAETVGVPLVLLAALLALEAFHRTGAPGDRARLLLLTGSGIAASSALLVKQNLLDGLVLAVVLAVAPPVRARAGARRVAVAGGAVVLGAAIPWAAAVLWSTTSGGARGLWYSVYGFRIASRTALFSHFSPAQVAHLVALGRSGVLSGLLPLMLFGLVVVLRPGRYDAVVVALGAMLLAELVGVAGGGSYWPHYLIGLVPGTCLLVARAAGSVTRLGVVAVVVGATLLATGTEVAYAVTHPPSHTAVQESAVSAWLTQAKHPGDSAVVLYGGAALYETTRLRPAYPLVWTLPQRILDPHLTLLVRLLDGAPGPTFVVVRSSLNRWQQDPRGRVQAALARHYRLFADVCGDTVLLRAGQQRTAPPAALCP